MGTVSAFLTRRYLFLLALAAGIVVLDQISKAIVTGALQGGKVVDLFGGVIRLDYTLNSGAAFGILHNEDLFFALIAVVVAGGILIFYRRLAASPAPVRVGLGLILGGATGNLIDRLRLGYVVDFIDLRWWPVFNLADSAIVIGVLVLLVNSLLEQSGERNP